jgi:hypothetical protein
MSLLLAILVQNTVTVLLVWAAIQLRQVLITYLQDSMFVLGIAMSLEWQLQVSPISSS